MNSWGELIKAATHRLDVDRELQLDVTQELQAHLEDSAAEFRKAGQSEEEAAANAARALGDPQELSEELWQANRGRMRIRGVIRWSLRVALIPLAIGVLVWILSGLGVVAGGPNIIHFATEFDFSSVSGISESRLKGLPEEDAYILRGDPQAKTALEREKSIHERWPDNLIYFGNYVIQYLAYVEGASNHAKRTGGEKRELLALLDRGKRIDPDNAFYDFTKAGYLMEEAVEIKDHPTDTYPKRQRSGKVKEVSYSDIKITDTKKFQLALDEVRSGLAKSQFCLRNFDMLELRKELWPENKRLHEYLNLVGVEASTLIPRLILHRQTTRALVAQAAHLAEKGKRKEALELVRMALGIGPLMGRKGDSIIEVLVSHTNWTTALFNASRVYELLGDEQQARTYREMWQKEVDFFRSLRLGQGSEKYRQPEKQGIIMSVFIPSVHDHPLDYEPTRTAEQYVATEFGLVGGLVGLLLVSLVTALRLMWESVLGSRQAKPLLVWIGWQQIGRICLWGILVPLIGYVSYAYVLTASNREHGVNYALGRIVLEYVVVWCVIVCLVCAMAYSAIRQRCRELGIKTPTPLRLRNRRVTAAIGGVLALIVAVYLVGWWLGPFKSFTSRYLGITESDLPTVFRSASVEGLFMAGAALVFVLVWAVRELVFGAFRSKQFEQFRRTFHRSLIPILASAVIVVGVVCGQVLSKAESSAAKRIKGDAAYSFTEEVERTTFRLLRERLAERHAELQKEQIGGQSATGR